MTDKAALLNKGKKLLSQGDYKEATKIFETALEDNPKNIELLYGLAYASFMFEDRKKALDNLNEALQYNPLFDKAYYLKARIYYYFTDEYDSAIEPILKAIELKPENSFYYSLAALIFYALKNDKRATKLAREAITYDECNYEAHLVLASRFKKKKNIEKSLEHYQLALQSGPKYEDTYFYLNTLHLELAKTKQGYKLIKSEARQYPDYQPYQWLLKFSYMRNQPLNLPFVLMEDISLPITVLIGIVIALLMLIGIMYTSESLCITIMTIFKWLCSIVFILYIPYQLLVYMALNIYYHTIVKPNILNKMA